MATLKRLSAYLLVFAVLIAGFVATGLWHGLDYLVYRTFYLDASKDTRLADNILLIDLPWRQSNEHASDSSDPTGYRQRLADLLDVFAGEEREPDAVVLDLWIANDPRGLQELEEAIRQLTDRGVRVYASLKLYPEGIRANAEELWQAHAPSVYQNALTGYGHTELDLFSDVLSYEAEVAIPAKPGTQIRQTVLALPVRVARDLNWRQDIPPGALVLPVGDQEKIDAQTFMFKHPLGEVSGGRFVRSSAVSSPASPSLNEKIVVIGSVEKDVHRGAPQAGPKLVTWALNERQYRDASAFQPLDHPALVLTQILAFAAFTVLVFALLFKYVKRLQTHPLVTASLSAGIAAAGLGVIGATMLILKYVTPVGLTLFSIVLTGLLAWRYAFKFLVTGVAEGSGKYDVFISYSRQHGDWVVKNVYEPLKVMRRADGSELSVFFDRTSIGLGEAFTAKYMRAIVDSRFFIPIFSDDYFSKNHCQNEMDVAYKRSVEKKIAILPIAFGGQSVPEIYSHLNYLDVEVNPQFIEGVQQTLLEAAPPGTE